MVDLLFTGIILITSLVILVKTSQWVIDSSLKLAKITGLSEMVIGFIFLAVATSLPELAVSLSAIASNDIGLSIGNLLGSNVADICLVIGIAALFGPLIIKEKQLKELSSILFLSSLIPILLLSLTYASRLVGVILIFVFFFFVYYSVKRGMKVKIEEKFERIDHMYPIKLWATTLFWFVLGFVGVFLSSRLIVDSASSIALSIGMTEAVIGATVIAIGTSLPELAVGITAMKAKRWHLLFGNAIGSTVTNITLILGTVLATTP